MQSTTPDPEPPADETAGDQAAEQAARNRVCPARLLRALSKEFLKRSLSGDQGSASIYMHCGNRILRCLESMERGDHSIIPTDAIIDN